MTTPAPTGSRQRQERAIAFGLGADLLLFFPYAAIAVLTGSVSILAEVLRGALMIVTEALGLHTLRRINRGRTGAYEYGLGKTERAVSGAVGAMLVAAAAFVLYRLATKEAGAEPSLLLGMASTALTVLNLLSNVMPMIPLWRASREDPSVTAVTQLRARLAKTVSSLAVVACVAIDAFSDDRGVALVADVVGGLVGAGFMIVIGIGLIREMLPDLLDRALAEPVQMAVNRTLAAFFDDYDELERVRTRRAGSVPHIEITIRFDPARTMGETSEICERMKEALRRSIPAADIVIVALSRGPRMSPATPGPVS